MPKPSFYDKADAKLCCAIMDALLDGLHQWRPDLSYPQSHSDLEGCVFEVMRRFEVTPRPEPVPLKLECYGEPGHENCGLGRAVTARAETDEGASC